MNRRLERVRAASFRTALLSVGITAAAFAVIAVVVVFYTDQTLTAQVDNRLSSQLQRLEQEQSVLPSIPLGDLRDDNSARYGPPLLGWVVEPSGTVVASDPSAVLPPQYFHITGPQSVPLGATEFRITGAKVAADYVLVGQSMVSISSARSTIVVAELIVGAVLLVVVFLGALAVGRRVGAPIELARQRQMEFTADASHELRTPLSVIEAQTSLALTHDREPEWYRHAFERVGAESRRIRRLVDDLLWLARVDSAGAGQRSEPVDVAVLATQAVDRFMSVAETRGLHLSLQVGAGLHVVSGSPDWLDRLLGVLLDNACKYTPEGGRVRVTVSGDGHRVRLAVEDSGPGIPAAERRRVLNRFHRANDLPGGAGLGLAIADAVVTNTHGRWEIGSSTLGGATMAVSWSRGLAGGREQARGLGGVQAPAR